MIVDKGKLHIKRFLARQATDVARGIAVGVANDGAVVAGTDMHLDFEYSRAPITLVSADFINNLIIFKATIPAEIEGTITDVGLFTSETVTGSAASFMVTDFSEGWSAGTLVGTNSKLGAQSLQLSATASTSQTTQLLVDLDFSDYTRDSEFKLALHTGSNVANVEVGFKSGVNTATYTFVPTVGYAIKKFKISDLVGTFGTPIDTLTVKVTATGGGTGTITLDGLRIDAYDPLDEENLMVARTVLAVPKTKQLGLPMDVQYNLEVNIT